jgi:hypothetical protein
MGIGVVFAWCNDSWPWLVLVDKRAEMKLMRKILGKSSTWLTIPNRELLFNE